MQTKAIKWLFAAICTLFCLITLSCSLEEDIEEDTEKEKERDKDTTDRQKKKTVCRRLFSSSFVVFCRCVSGRFLLVSFVVLLHIVRTNIYLFCRLIYEKKYVTFSLEKKKQGTLSAPCCVSFTLSSIIPCLPCRPSRCRNIPPGKGRSLRPSLQARHLSSGYATARI